MWQTQSIGPVRTPHTSVPLTVNTVSHNPAQSSFDNDDDEIAYFTMRWKTRASFVYRTKNMR